MSDYTPTMARIEDMYAWAYAWRTVDSLDDGETDLSGLRATQRAEFQRALAAHDRKIAAEALREAAETFARTVGEPAHPGRSVVCLDMKTGVVTDVQTWLRDRADRIEQGGES